MKDLSDFCPEFQEAAAYYASLNTPSDQAILVEFLRETQDIFGCIPNDAKEQIASIMQVKPALIDTLIRLYPSLSSQTYQKEIIVYGKHLQQQTICPAFKKTGAKASDPTGRGNF